MTPEERIKLLSWISIGEKQLKDGTCKNESFMKHGIRQWKKKVYSPEGTIFIADLPLEEQTVLYKKRKDKRASQNKEYSLFRRKSVCNGFYDFAMMLNEY